MRKYFVLLIVFLVVVAFINISFKSAEAMDETLTITNAAGLRLMTVSDYSQVKLLLPGQADADDGILIDCPEIISLGMANGQSNLIYALFNSNYPDVKVKWVKSGNQLHFVMDKVQMIKLTCTVTLEADGVRVNYALTNLGNEAFPWVIASSCNRMRSAFYDVFLERTYVHHPEGFALLAGFIPERAELPVEKWLPVRVRAAYTTEPPTDKKSIGYGGVATYDNPEKVDLPLVATRSADGKWIAVTCSALNPGQVWSNPQLTCHHTDAAIPLAAGATATVETKTFVFMGSLPDALAKVKQERERAGR